MQEASLCILRMSCRSITLHLLYPLCSINTICHYCCADAIHQCLSVVNFTRIYITVFIFCSFSLISITVSLKVQLLSVYIRVELFSRYSTIFAGYSMTHLKHLNCNKMNKCIYFVFHLMIQNIFLPNYKTYPSGEWPNLAIIPLVYKRNAWWDCKHAVVNNSGILLLVLYNFGKRSYQV